MLTERCLFSGVSSALRLRGGGGASEGWSGSPGYRQGEAKPAGGDKLNRHRCWLPLLSPSPAAPAVSPLHLLIASPSASRTMGMPTTCTAGSTAG